MIVVLYLVALTAVWVLAWGSLTVANLLGGLAVGSLVLWIGGDCWTRKGPVRIRPVAIGRLVWHILTGVVLSNLDLTRSVLSPSRLHTGVMAVPLPECSDGVMTLISNIVALTPGTNPVHMTRAPTVLYVHVLNMDNVDACRDDVTRLAELAIAAFGPSPVRAASRQT